MSGGNERGQGKLERVAVTGMGVLTSIGLNKEAFWTSLSQGKLGFSEITSFDPAKFGRNRAAEIKDFRVEDFFPGDTGVAKLGRAKQLTLAAARECLEDAGAGAVEDPFRVGVAIGTTNGEALVQQVIVDAYAGDGLSAIPDSAPGNYPPNTIPQAVAEYFGLCGPNLMLPNACAAGNFAIGYAYDCIRTGQADAMIAGGADAFSRGAFAGFLRLGAVSPDLPRPFSLDRQGMVPGEGAGLIFLESYDRAVRRGARIYAELVGYGQSCDAWHITQPNVDGIARALQGALADSVVPRGSISYISVHGTGTSVNDPTESNALKEVFGEGLSRIPVSSVKSMIGHSMGAASAIECIAAILSLVHQYITPTMNFLAVDPECDVDCVPNSGRKAEVKYVLKTSSAFGGNNAVLVLKAC